MNRLLDYATGLLDRAHLPQGALALAESGLHLLRFAAETPQTATVYRPLLCLVLQLQGAKQVNTATRTLTVANGQSLIVSHALPVVSRTIEATREIPYPGLVFPLDLELLRGFAPAVPPRPARERHIGPVLDHALPDGPWHGRRADPLS